jgi:hypothetical protein
MRSLVAGYSPARFEMDLRVHFAVMCNCDSPLRRLEKITTQSNGSPLKQRQ